VRSEEAIREKLQQVEEESLKTVKRSHDPDDDTKAVNRGAVYGWSEALNWVMEEPMAGDTKERDSGECRK